MWHTWPILPLFLWCYLLELVPDKTETNSTFQTPFYRLNKRSLNQILVMVSLNTNVLVSPHPPPTHTCMCSCVCVCVCMHDCYLCSIVTSRKRCSIQLLGFILEWIEKDRSNNGGIEKAAETWSNVKRLEPECEEAYGSTMKYSCDRSYCLQIKSLFSDPHLQIRYLPSLWA